MYYGISKYSSKLRTSCVHSHPFLLYKLFKLVNGHFNKYEQVLELTALISTYSKYIVFYSGSCNRLVLV